MTAVEMLQIATAVFAVVVVASALDEGVQTVFRLEVWDYRASWRRFLRRYNLA